MYTFIHGNYEFCGAAVLQREAPFLAWCLDQGRKNPNRPIKHDSGWQGCAIGDYAKANGFEHNGLCRDAPPGYGNWTHYTDEHVPEKLRDLLDRANCIKDNPHHDKLKTYGGLAGIIADWYVVSVIADWYVVSVIEDTKDAD